MIKKWMLTCCLMGAVIFGWIGCGGGKTDSKYAPIKTMVTKQVKLFNKTTAALNKADNADEIAAAIENWAEGMEAFLPDYEKHAQILAELKEMDTPLELQAVNMEMDRAGREMGEASAKIQQYMSDPKVQAAQEKLMKVMKKLQEIDPTLR